MDVRRNFLKDGVIGRWNGLHREVVESPSWQMFKEQLDVALSAVVLDHSLDSMISEVFSNLTDFVIQYLYLAVLICLMYC